MINLILVATFNLDIIYVVFNLLLLLVFYLAGQNVSNGESYWKNANICIVSFVFIFGSRYMRGNDYAHYVDAYLNVDEGHEFLFTAINAILRNYFDIGKYLIFYIYAIPFVCCGFKFLKNFIEYSRWLFPVFLICMTYFEEYEIRQSFGFSFVFLFMDELMSTTHTIKKKVALCTIYSILVLGIHSANILFILLFLFLFFTFKRIINWKISIPLLVFSSYFFSKFYDLSYVTPILNILEGTGNAKFVQYTSGDAPEAWFGESALQLENERNAVVKLLDLLANAALYYFAWIYLKFDECKNGRMVVTLTNLYIIGDISRKAFLYLELLNRLAGMFQRMWFLPFVVIVSTIRYNELSHVERIAYLLMFFLFYDYLKYLIFPNEGMTQFLWDVL